MKKEKEILKMLKAGATIKATAKKLGIKNHQVFSVKDKYRAEIPEKEPKRRWSVRVSKKLTVKMLAEIHRREISPTELLNEIIGGWYDNR